MRSSSAKASEVARALPGLKQVWRVVDGGGVAYDSLGLLGETQKGRPLLRCVMREGTRTMAGRSVGEIAKTAQRSREELPSRVRAIERVEPVDVRLTPALTALAESSRARIQRH